MIACICNIIADLIFVAGFDMGATGAAFATIIAQAISVVISLPPLLRREFLWTIEIP
jgi:Na+-driven multidrug efflux pump